jgi:hypothetical protein
MTIDAPLVRIVEEKYLLQRDRRRWAVETTVLAATASLRNSTGTHAT